MASSPEGSPSPPSRSPDNSPPPPQSASPPPPVESKSPSPPPPPSSSSSPPPTPPASPPPPPPLSSSSPPPSLSSSSPPPPQNNAAASTNATPSPPPPPHALSPPPPKRTLENGAPSLASAPPPPSKSHSTPSSHKTGSDPSDLPIILGFSVGIVLLLIIIVSLTIAIICKKKKKSKINDQIQYYNKSPSPPNGGDGGGYGTSPRGQNGYQANNHLVINLPPPPRGNAGRGRWPSPGGNADHGGWPPALLPQGPPQGGNAGGGGWPPPTPQGPMADLGSEMSPGYSVQQSPPLPPGYASPMGLNQSAFTYEELALATQGFSQANLLGQGGFGFVHKGVLPNSKVIAVKSLKSGSGQGQREFQAEVEIISRVHHRHLVTLVGYCIDGDKKMLVYEFLPNNTLEFHLHDKNTPAMDWPTRVKIAVGAAKGLAYLHEDCHPRIIHRDIKSANILLDYNFEAKVADFGLAKLTQDNNTHVSTRVMGTFGYLAPEYASSGKLTDKSDVFSFGVVLLELITGRRPLDLSSAMEESLVDWARPLCNSAVEDGDFSKLADPRLENNFVHDEMARMVACAGACIRHSARRRPTMRQILRGLEDDVPLDDLTGGVRSGQSSGMGSMSGSYDYDSDMAKFKKVGVENYASSQWGNTSEYGLNPSSSSSDSSGPIGRREP